MRTFTLVATVIVLLANAAFVAKTNAQSPYTIKDPRWTVEFGGKAFDRPGDQLGLPLITDGITNDTLFDSGEASNLGSAVGAEVKFDFVTKRGRELEIRSSLASWEQSYEINGDNLRSPFFTVPGSEPTTVDYDYESDYFSIELMERRAVSPGITFLFGPRFVSTRDQVTFAGTLAVDPGDGSPPVDFVATQNTEATNALIGGQIGFELNFPISNHIYIQGVIRTGGYVNPTELINTSSDNFSGVVTQTREFKSTGSFLAEAGGRIYGEIVPNSVATYVGYEATWIDGIAIAPASLITTGGGVETANTIFIQAVTFGFDFTYGPRMH